MLDFDPATLPWVDRNDFEETLSNKLKNGQIHPKDVPLLRQWSQEGYVILRNAIEHRLIHSLWSNFERALRERPLGYAEVEGKGILAFSKLPPREELQKIVHYRFYNFHNLSEAGKRILLHPSIIRFMRLIFEETPVGLQSLLFEYGSEQGRHQDHIVVHTDIPSHLAAAWIACEDADDKSGPLLFYPGSHRLPKYDFGNGTLINKARNDYTVLTHYSKYLNEILKSREMKPRLFLAKKGDVLLWHAALVHGGGKREDSTRSRKSFVTHYSTVTAYPRDNRWPTIEPRTVKMNQGICYEARYRDHIEDLYPLSWRKLWSRSLLRFRFGTRSKLSRLKNKILNVVR